MTDSATSGNPYRAVLDVSAALVSSLDLETVFENVARRIGEAMMVTSVDIQTYDRVRGALVYEVWWSLDADIDRSYRGTVIDVHDGPGWLPIVEGRETVEQHIDDPDLPAVDLDGMKRWGYKTTLDAPLMVGGEVIGVLGLAETRFVRHFTATELDLFGQFCELAALAIHNATVFRRLETQTTQMGALIDASRAIASSVGVGDVLHTVAEKATLALGTSECVIYEHDEARDALVWRAMYPMDDFDELKAREGTVYPLDENPSDRRILESGRTVVEHISDPGLPDDARASMEKWGEKTCINVPLMLEDEARGIMVLLETETERRLSDDELGLALALGEQAALAMTKAQTYERQRQEAVRMRALLDANRAITSPIDLEEVLQTVAEKAATALGTEQCAIHEYDEGRDALVWRALYPAGSLPDDAPARVGAVYPLADSPSDRAILSSARPVVETISDPRLGADTRASMEEWGEKTCVNVPLMFDAKALGIMALVETGQERSFTDDDLDLAMALGEQAATAIRKAQIYERLEKQNRRLLDLLKSSHVMTGSMDVENAVETMCTEIAGLLDCPVCHIDVALRDEEGRYVPPEVVAAEEDAIASAEPSLVPDTLIERALAEHRPAQAAAPEGGEARLVIPLLAKNEPSGFVELSGPLHATFAREELEAVQILANQAAVAIDNARLLQERGRQAITDGLTTLYNHRFFYDRLRAEMVRSLRYLTPLSLLLLDVDDFKLFNDTHGHLAGDEVLRTIGTLLRQGVRQHLDLPCRYGGEEFAVILPNTAVTGARAFAERLQERMDGVDEEVATAGAAVHTSGRPLQPYTGPERRRAPRPAGADASGVEPGTPPAAANPEGAEIVGERVRRRIAALEATDERGEPLRRVTVSIGVAAFPEHAVDVDDLVEAADQALYIAKKSGKNRVVVSEAALPDAPPRPRTE